ncbi:ABC transporter ATP-binding protein [Paracoccus sp. (in: a-proteobacteria)]|uniref:ABC transporter ATP-binding protein n=1 Tax=Paracoccus sp. TaxID=267 RepID=UPI002AFE2567|nr:ABC transporter ATP-binding protein [Paracoccus sp. (in: a-proteobacteria)]
MSISVSNLTKKYGALSVIHGISFDVAQGEFLSLLGPSGCGKTTTLRCLAGLEDASGGVISFGGQVVSEPERDILVPVHERQVGMVFQSYAIWPHMTVAQNVGFPLSVRNVPKSDIAQQVDEALAIVELGALKDRYPAQLSGGQQQRVALARAIVGRPRVLLFDEPLSNLDAKLREGTRAEIRRLQKHLNVAAVYVTHDQEEALSMSDRVIVMDKGTIQQIGTPKELYRAPVNHFVADFVGRASFIDLERGESGWVGPDGTPIPVHDAVQPKAQRFQAMLRPESIEIVPQSEAAAGSGLPGTIAGSQYLGAVTEYIVNVAGAKVKVHSHRDFADGMPVSVQFARENCRLIAAEGTV